MTGPGQSAVDDDPALLAALRAGDPASYERFVREFSPRLLSIARKMMPTEEDAQDALQDAFLAAFRGLPRFDGNARLSTWMHRVTVNACLMPLRTRRRRPERSIEDLLPRFAEDGHVFEPVAAWGESPSGQIGDDTLAAVREAIDELPEMYRTVLVLRDIEGLDTDEAAAALDIAPNTLKTRLHRARLALRALLDPRMREGQNSQTRKGPE